MEATELEKHKRAIILDLEKIKYEHQRADTNHILHLLLSCITFGVWLIVWLLVSNGNKNKRANLDNLVKQGNDALAAIDVKMEKIREREFQDQHKTCQWCAETIMAKALICKHCGKDV